jgi:tetratricopeptide (TPR) repeat protein
MKFLPLVLIFAFAACSSPAAEKPIIKQDKSARLSEGEMFSSAMVAKFVSKNPILNEKANVAFLEAIDLFRNKKQFQPAFEKFCESILVYPTSKAYYEFANLMVTMKNFTGALHAYDMAEQLGYEPFSKVLYNKSCLYSLMEEVELSGAYLEYALQAGYTNIDQINKDEDLENLRNEPIFEQKLKSGLSGMSNPESLYWLQFKRQFPTFKFPLVLDEKTDKKTVFTTKSNINYDFERFIAEMRDDKFSRDVGKSFMYYAMVKESEKFVAVIYAIQDEMYTDAENKLPLTYRMATFTHEGKLIDKKEIGGRSLMDAPLKTCIIQKDGSFELVAFETIFEKNPAEEGYSNNPVKSKTELSRKKFKINAAGNFVG